MDQLNQSNPPPSPTPPAPSSPPPGPRGKASQKPAPPQDGRRTRWRDSANPMPRLGSLAGKGRGRRQREGKAKLECTGSPHRPPPASRTVLAAAVAGWQLHGALGARTGSQAAGAPAPPAPEQVAENCPSEASSLGSRTRGWENDTPQRGGSPGRSHLASWATPRAGGSLLVLPAEGCMPFWGCGGCLAHCEDHRCAQGAGGRAPGAAPLRDASDTQFRPDDTVDALHRGCRGSNFLAEVEVGMWGWKGGSAVSWSPLEARGVWDPGFLFLFFFSFLPALPASLPYSFYRV